MNELRELFALAGDAGAVIVVSLSAWGIVRSFVAIADIVARSANARNAIDEKRNEVDEKMALTMLRVVATQERIVEKLNTNDLRVTEIGTIVNGAVKSMNEAVDIRSKELEGLPGRVREEMANDFEQLPSAIEKALAPTIESLKGDIAELIIGLDEKLTTRIIQATGNIPSETATMIKDEIAKLERVIESKLAEFLEVAKLAVNNNVPRVEPGETVNDNDKPKES